MRGFRGPYQKPVGVRGESGAPKSFFSNRPVPSGFPRFKLRPVGCSNNLDRFSPPPMLAVSQLRPAPSGLVGWAINQVGATRPWTSEGDHHGPGFARIASAGWQAASWSRNLDLAREEPRG